MPRKAPPVDQDLPKGAFAESLDLAEFKALSPGIGLGELKPTIIKSTETKNRIKTIATPPMHIIQRVQQKEPHPPLQTKKIPLRWPKPVSTPHESNTLWPRFFAYFLDLLIVVLSSLAVFFVAGYFFQFQSNTKSVFNLILYGLSWISGFGSLKISLGTVGVFACYFVLFRLLAGMTLGESLIKRE